MPSSTSTPPSIAPANLPALTDPVALSAGLLECHRAHVALHGSGWPAIVDRHRADIAHAMREHQTNELGAICAIQRAVGEPMPAPLAGRLLAVACDLILARAKRTL
jgi:hypothetical protein